MKNIKFGLIAAAALGLAGLSQAQAQDVIKVGVIVPLTGPQAAAGQQIVAAMKLYQQFNGTKVGNKTI